MKVQIDEEGAKVYDLKGTLFFASISGFQALFTPQEDPSHVVIDFKQAKVMGHSALAAIDSPAYQNAGKNLLLKHLSHDCKELLKNAQGLVEVNLMEYPKYHVADNAIS